MWLVSLSVMFVSLPDFVGLEALLMRRKTKFELFWSFFTISFNLETLLAPCVAYHMPNGISHPYHLDKSISNLRVLGSNLKFHSKSKSTFCKQTMQYLIRCHILWHLIWLCTVCWYPINGPRLIWVNFQAVYFFIQLACRYVFTNKQSVKKCGSCLAGFWSGSTLFSN